MAGEGIQVVLTLILSLVVIVFVTLGAVLALHFWAMRFSTSARAFAASALAILVLFGPVVGIVATEEPMSSIAIVAGSVTMFVITFPVAFLATRKLDRRKQDIGAIFE
jgi:hypothetical protein